MSRPFTGNPSLQARRPGSVALPLSVARPRQGDDAVDSNAVRWVFAGTVAFWVVVFEAGRFLF